MTGNRSLDEFLSGDDEAAADDAGSSDSTPDVEPITPTCVWSPGGAPCDDCGAVVEERWRDADDLVCADCKAW